MTPFQKTTMAGMPLSFEQEIYYDLLWLEWNYLWYSKTWRMYGCKSKQDAIEKVVFK